jgi:hypothetical protein
MKVGCGTPNGLVAFTGRLAALAWCAACASPPASQFPDAETALSRMREGLSCSRGLRGQAQLDYFHQGGRARAEAHYLTS